MTSNERERALLPRRAGPPVPLGSAEHGVPRGRIAAGQSALCRCIESVT